MREDQIDQAERQAVLENDRLVREQQKQRETSTFFQHSQSLADETSGGRFRANGTPRLIGATPTPQYPQAGPPFHRDPVPDEPPLPAHDNPALDETSTASPCVEATDDPADAPLSGSGSAAKPSDGLVSEPAGSSPSSPDDRRVR